MQAARVGLDPWRVLAPGDRVEKLIERELIQALDADGAEERLALSRASAVLTGQLVALSLGADAKAVFEITALLLKGADDDGEG